MPETRKTTWKAHPSDSLAFGKSFGRTRPSSRPLDHEATKDGPARPDRPLAQEEAAPAGLGGSRVSGEAVQSTKRNRKTSAQRLRSTPTGPTSADGTMPSPRIKKWQEPGRNVAHRRWERLGEAVPRTRASGRQRVQNP